MEAKQIVDDVFGYGKAEIVTSYLLAAELQVATNEANVADELVARARDTSQAQLGNHPDHARALYIKALLSTTKGRHSKAMSYLEASATMYASTLGGDSLEVGQVAMLRARVELSRGRFKSAKKALEIADSIIRFRLGEDSVCYGEVLYLKAKQRISVGNHSEGKQFLAKSREIVSEKLMPGQTVSVQCDSCPPIMCQILILSARLNVDFGRLEAAEKELAIARQSTFLSFGEGPMLGDILVEISRVKHVKGEVAICEELTRRALGCYSKLAGDRNPRVAMASVELAHALAAMARYDEALTLASSGLKCLLAVCGPRHFDTARGYMVQGSLFMDIREDTASRESLERCVRILEVVHGKDHVRVCNAQVVFAQCLTNRCEFPEAERLLEHADSAMVAFSRHSDARDGESGQLSAEPKAEDNIFYCKVIVGFAQLYLERAMYLEAEALLQRVLPLAKMLSGKDGPLTQKILFLFGLLHGTLANWQDGHDSFEQASVLARNLFGSKSPLVFRSGLNDARLYLEQSAFREATGRLAELEIFEPLPSPIDAAEIRILRGDLQLALGRHKAGKDFYCSALRILNARYYVADAGYDVPRVARQVEPHVLCAWAAQKLGNCLLEWERWHDAELVLKEARDVFAQFDTDRKHPKLGDILWRHAFALSKLGNENTNDMAIGRDTELKPYVLEMFVDVDGQRRARTVTHRWCDRTENDLTRDEFTLAKEILDESLGPDHPRFATFACALGEYHRMAGLGLWAVRLCRQACASTRTSFGRETPMTALALTALAEAEGSIGEWEKSSAAATDAAWIWDRIAKKYAGDAHGPHLARHPHRYRAQVLKVKAAFAVCGGADVETRTDLEHILTAMRRERRQWLECFELSLRMRDENERAKKLVGTYPVIIEGMHESMEDMKPPKSRRQRSLTRRQRKRK